MKDFNQRLLSIIEESEHTLFEIERALFTKRYNLLKKHYEILSVQSISMIYSIWEGYVQKAFQLYIQNLNSLNIPFSDYADGIIVLHMEKSFKQLKRYPENNKKKITLFKQLENFYNTQTHLLHPTIETKSNVSFSTLNEILISFSLAPFPKFWQKYKHPNPNLEETMTTFLRYRNGIAHGGDLSSEEKVTSEVFAKYRSLVSDLMYEIQKKMEEGISLKKYHKHGL